MNRTKIEWVKNPDGTQGYTWNPVTGCLNNCPYCYARRLANGRLKQRYLGGNAEFAGAKAYQEGKNDPFYPRFWAERCHGDLYTVNYPEHGKGKGIFVCDMGDLFGIGVPHKWTAKVITEIMLYPWHRFYLLTKQPQNLIKFNPFPDNCWVGFTATDNQMFNYGLAYLSDVGAKVKYASLEPLLGRIEPVGIGSSILDWLIIGAMTGTGDIEGRDEYLPLSPMPYGKRWTLPPKIEWVEEIVRAADKAGVPVFLKNNLKLLILQHAGDKDAQWANILLDAGGKLRQEAPV